MAMVFFSLFDVDVDGRATSSPVLCGGGCIQKWREWVGDVQPDVGVGDLRSSRSFIFDCDGV